MGKRIVKLVLLCLVIAGGIVGGVFFFGKYSAQKKDCEARLAEAQETLAAAEADRDSVDRSTPQGAEAWQKVVGRLMDEGEEAAKDAEKALEKAQSDENYEYYKAIYDAEAEGVEKVEGYIEKSN